MLARYVGQSNKITKESVIRLADQLGQELDLDKLPLEASDFPDDIQAAFFVFDILSDRISDSSGIFLGKHWDSFEYYCTLYFVDSPTFTLEILKYYEGLLVNKSIQDYKNRMEQEERKTKQAGGKSYTHNVTG